jgi:nitrate reductase gamma subunit
MRQRRERIWGESGGDRRRNVWPLVAGGGLLALAATAALGFLIVVLLRSELAGDSPFGAVFCLGGVMFGSLCAAIGLVLLAARRFGIGSSEQRTILVGGFAIVMACAPCLMLLVVFLLARGTTP